MPIDPNNIAAAQIASLFGNELLNIKEKVTEGSSTSNFNIVDPRSLLTGVAQTPNRTLEEQRILQLVQQEAEATWPAAPDEAFRQPPPAQQQPPIGLVIPAQGPPAQQPSVQPQVEQPVQFVGYASVMERIANSLERIAARLEAVDILLKKRKVTRRK